MNKGDFKAFFAIVVLGGIVIFIGFAIGAIGPRYNASAAPGKQESILSDVSALEVKVIRRDLAMRPDEICVILESTEDGIAPLISCKIVTSDESDIEFNIYQDADALYENDDYELWWVEVERVALNMYWGVLVPKQPSGQPALG